VAADVCYKGENAKFVDFLVKRGDAVKAGDALAVLEIYASEADLNAVILDRARGEEDYIKGKEERLKAISEAEYALASINESYERQAHRLRVERMRLEYSLYCHQQDWHLSRLQMTIDEMKKRRSQTELVAPFSGIVDNIAYKRPEDMVWDGERLVTIYDPSDMLLRVDNSLQYFRYGLPVQVECGTQRNRNTLAGQIIASDNIIHESRRRGYAFIKLAPYKGEVTFINMSATVSTFSLDNVIVVPRKALLLQGGKHYVNKLIDGSLSKRYVLLGMTSTQTAWVYSGLCEGEVVVID
jgi:multidrug resistance efflux pump